MALGFEGFIIVAPVPGTGAMDIFELKTGFKGVSIEASTRMQFFEAKKGFKGFSIEKPLVRSAIIIRRI